MTKCCAVAQAKLNMSESDLRAAVRRVNYNPTPRAIAAVNKAKADREECRRRLIDHDCCALVAA